MTKLSVTTFDYSQVSKEEKGKLVYYAAEIRKAKKSHAEAIIETGKLLAEVQSVMSNHGSGTFCEWVDLECGFGKSTAYRYIDAFEAFKDCPNLGQMDPSAMYLLAKNDDAKKAAIKMATKNTPVTHAVAKGLVAEAKEREPATPKPKLTPTAPPKNVVDTGDIPEAFGEPNPTPDESCEPCPNCGGTEWKEDFDGIACAKCFHPQGESLGDADDSIELPAWANSRQSVDAFRVNVNTLLKSLKDAPKQPGYELLHKHGARIRMDLENAKAALVGCVPHEFCPYCNGMANDCQPCSDRGWMNKVDYENIPKEIRDEAEKLPSGGGR